MLALVAEIMEADSEEEYIKVVGEVPFMRQIRQYSARFIWGYDSRGCMMNTNTRNTNNIYIRVACAVQDEFYSKSSDIYTDLEQLEIEYVVLYKEKQFEDHLPQDSYEIIGETKEYKVVKMKYGIRN